MNSPTVDIRLTIQISVSAVLALILNDYFNANPRKVK